MPAVSVNSYGRRSSISARSRRSEASTRSRTKQPADDSNPDAEELRQIRTAYFGHTSTPPNTQSVATTTTNTRSAAPKSDRPRKKRHPPASSLSSKSGPRKKDGSPASDYVYGQPLVPVASALMSGAIKKSQPSSRDTARRRQPAYRSARPNSLSTLAEEEDTDDEFEEVTPDDSISVVAARQHAGAGAGPRVKSRRQPSKLGPISETGPGNHRPSNVAPRQVTKRSTGLFGALFGRNNTSPTAPAPSRLIECLTCGSDKIRSTRAAKLECGHRMCHACLKRVFELSVKDAVHMPPTCCTESHIPLKHVDKLFDVRFKTLWNRKYQEYHTKNRVYCPARRCGEWIKPSQIQTKNGRKFAACPRCKTKVCVLCNHKMHKSRECPKDPEIAALVAQAKEKGWQRCFNCSAMVELDEGCNHMTCRCTAEFCMCCGAAWKTCDCPWFSYTTQAPGDRLVEMRVPQPIPEPLPESVHAPYRSNQGPASPAQDRSLRDLTAAASGPRTLTYRDEMAERRRQERLDADLARRLQFASLMDPVDPGNYSYSYDNNHRPDNDATAAPRFSRRPNAPASTFGLGNSAPHFMNENFVSVPANVTMSTFGDATMGRRGERISGRKRRPKAAPGIGRPADRGLVSNFLGDESVLGVTTR